MGQSTMSNRDIGFCHLLIVEGSGKFIITSGKLSGLSESPRKVPVSILFVAFPQRLITGLYVAPKHEALMLPNFEMELLYHKLAL